MSKDRDTMHKAFSDLEESANKCLDKEHYLRVQRALDSINATVGCTMDSGPRDEADRDKERESRPCDDCQVE